MDSRPCAQQTGRGHCDTDGSRQTEMRELTIGGKWTSVRVEKADRCMGGSCYLKLSLFARMMPLASCSKVRAAENQA